MLNNIIQEKIQQPKKREPKSYVYILSVYDSVHLTFNSLRALEQFIPEIPILLYFFCVQQLFVYLLTSVEIRYDWIRYY